MEICNRRGKTSSAETMKKALLNPFFLNKGEIKSSQSEKL
jgi:hypothetical protein